LNIFASLVDKIVNNGKRIPIIVLIVVLGIHLSSCLLLEARVRSPKEVINRQDQLINRTITIRGPLNQTYLYCTEQECEPEQPCCNVCAGGVGFQVGGDVIHWVGESYGCSGNNCEVNCEPSGIGKVYTVRGVLRLSGGGLDLEVDSYSLEE
jgi:hypothetical protein